MNTDERITMIKRANENVQRRNYEDGQRQTWSRVNHLSEIDNDKYLAKLTEEII